MKKVGIIIFFLLTSLCLYSEDRKLVTVMDFKTNRVSEQEMIIIVDYISSTISNNLDYELVERAQRNEILKEMEFSNSGCVDESCQIEIGRLLAANQMVIGSIGTVGSFYILNMKLVDIETGKTIYALSKRFANVDEMILNIDQTVFELFDPDFRETKKPEKDLHLNEIADEEMLAETDTPAAGNTDISTDFIKEGSQVWVYTWNNKKYDQVGYELLDDVIKSGDYDTKLHGYYEDQISIWNTGTAVFIGGAAVMLGSLILPGTFMILNPDQSEIATSVMLGGAISGFIAWMVGFAVIVTPPTEFVDYYNANHPF